MMSNFKIYAGVIYDMNGKSYFYFVQEMPKNWKYFCVWDIAKDRCLLYNVTIK